MGDDAAPHGGDERLTELGPRTVQDPTRVDTDRYVLRSNDDARCPVKRSKAIDACRVLRGDDDDQLVVGKGPTPVDQTRIHERLHVALVGRCEDVGRGSLFDLEAQDLAPREAQPHVDVGVGPLEASRERIERLGQRRRRKDRELDSGCLRSAAGAAPGAQHEEGDGERGKAGAGWDVVHQTPSYGVATVDT